MCMLSIEIFTWQVFSIHTAQVTQSVFIVKCMVPNDAVIFTGQVIKSSMHRRHARQSVQHLLHVLYQLLHTDTHRYTLAASPYSLCRLLK